MQHGGWGGRVTQVGKFIKATSILLRASKLQREKRKGRDRAWGAAHLQVEFLSLIDSCHQGGKIFITWGEDSCKQGFHTFSSLFGQGFPVMEPAILGLSGWIWLLGEVLPGQAPDLPNGCHGFRIARLQVSC